MGYFVCFFKAIEAMKNAHRTEMEKELDKARKANSNSGNADVEEIRKQHEYINLSDEILCPSSSGLIICPAKFNHWSSSIPLI